MRHKLLVLAVKKILQSVYIYISYRKIKTGVPFFGPPGSLVIILNIVAVTVYMYYSPGSRDSCCVIVIASDDVIATAETIRRIIGDEFNVSRLVHSSGSQ